MTTTRLLAAARNALAAIGVLFLVLAAFVHVQMWRETHRPMPTLAQTAAASPVAERLAARIAPGLQAAAAEYEPEFLLHAAEHGVLARYAASRAYPVVVREIPRGSVIVADRLMSEFGSMSLSDVAAAIVDHARAKGAQVHPSFRGRESVPFERRSMADPSFLPSR